MAWPKIDTGLESVPLTSADSSAPEPGPAIVQVSLAHDSEGLQDGQAANTLQVTVQNEEHAPLIT